MYLAQSYVLKNLWGRSSYNSVVVWSIDISIFIISFVCEVCVVDALRKTWELPLSLIWGSIIGKIYLMMVYYALDFPRPIYDYDYASNAPGCNGYAEDDLAPIAVTEGANARWGYYDDGYIYASWRLG